MFLRVTITFWGVVFAGTLIVWGLREERLEREYPTPHELPWLMRKGLRDAHKFMDPKHGSVRWSLAFQHSRLNIMKLEEWYSAEKERNPKGVVKLEPGSDYPEGPYCALNPHNVSAMSEEWRHGYFETMMLAAKAAEHVDGWVVDPADNCACPPQYVVGPSNPRPLPMPPGAGKAPREEDCKVAFPPADRFYWKILNTEGLTQRQRTEAAIEFASFMDFKKEHDAAEMLYSTALLEASQGIDQANLPYDTKRLTIKDGCKPSSNVLDALTAIANYKARSGKLQEALPVYLSLLKVRRGLSNDRPPLPKPNRQRQPVYQQMLNFLSPPDYPTPPTDGTEIPWRSPNELCQEASLSLYIGEILYASSSREDGVAWTRDGVDLAEEQLRRLEETKTNRATAQLGKECLKTGLDNWATMVARLAEKERERVETGQDKPGVVSFWSSPRPAESRWAAEEEVITERIRRTRELLDTAEAPTADFWALFKA